MELPDFVSLGAHISHAQLAKSSLCAGHIEFLESSRFLREGVWLLISGIISDVYGGNGHDRCRQEVRLQASVTDNLAKRPMSFTDEA